MSKKGCFIYVNSLSSTGAPTLHILGRFSDLTEAEGSGLIRMLSRDAEIEGIDPLPGFVLGMESDVKEMNLGDYLHHCHVAHEVEEMVRETRLKTESVSVLLRLAWRAAELVEMIRNTRQEPHWDAELRELHLGNESLKRYRQPAGNQTLILAAFEESGWPEKIDDPLPGGHDAPSQRLRDAIKGLNKAQDRIRFEADGTGTGITWTQL